MSNANLSSRLPIRPRERGLVLGRKAGETIELDLPHGGGVVFTFLPMRKGNFRVHIAAPTEVGIRRGELPHTEAA